MSKEKIVDDTPIKGTVIINPKHPPTAKNLKAWVKIGKQAMEGKPCYLGYEGDVFMVTGIMGKHDETHMILGGYSDTVPLSRIPMDTMTGDTKDGPWTPIWVEPTPEEIVAEKIKTLETLIADAMRRLKDSNDLTLAITRELAILGVDLEELKSSPEASVYYRK